jgi:hypothetical protein
MPVDKRTKTLSIAFAVLVVGMLGYKVAYPRWIEPLLSVDEIIAEKEKELAKLRDKEMAIDKARRMYPRYANRVGSMSKRQVENDARARLNALIEEHQLEKAKVSKARTREDRKTQLAQLTITVDAEGTLENAIKFMKSMQEMPDLMRVNSVRLSPSGSSRRTVRKERADLWTSMTFLVLPQQKVLGKKLVDADLEQKEELIRHAGREYAQVWNADPFNEYVKPAPPPPPPPPRQVVKKEPEKPKEEPKRPERKKSLRWKDRKRLEICMALISGDGGSPEDQLMLYDSSRRDTRYIKVGEEIDGGTLRYVDYRGALVDREDGRFIYPLGQKLDDEIPLDKAEQFASLQEVAASIPVEKPGEEDAEDGDESASADQDADGDGDKDAGDRSRSARSAAAKAKAAAAREARSKTSKPTRPVRRGVTQKPITRDRSSRPTRKPATPVKRPSRSVTKPEAREAASEKAENAEKAADPEEAAADPEKKEDPDKDAAGSDAKTAQPDADSNKEDSGSGAKSEVSGAGDS